jgi:hypothetical protein
MKTNVFLEIDDFPVTGFAFSTRLETYTNSSAAENDGSGRLSIVRQSDEYSSGFATARFLGHKFDRIAVVNEKVKDDDPFSLIARSVLTLSDSVVVSFSKSGSGSSSDHVTFFYEKAELKFQANQD